MSVVDLTRLESAYAAARDLLLAERHPDGYWVGELSTSALSTATAVGALALAKTPNSQALIANGLRWLAEHQNPDGGWGDTVRSVSNISTTMLCRAAFHLSESCLPFRATLAAADAYMNARCGPTPAQHAEGIRARYGKDRTFSVPILMTCALAGLVEWREVPPLPFELACLPQAWFRWLNLPVVSYALPALIAIGQAIHHHRPPNLLFRAVRNLAKKRSLRVLEHIQPSSGGFLEATPLTSFVIMGLASIGRADHPVVRKGLNFLRQSVRPDGSWPIDSNLSVWVTTLAVNALAAAGELPKLDKLKELRDWILARQFKERHPYTGAAPGGWGWTHLPGSVPDADDTAGALLALAALGPEPAGLTAGLSWLYGLQNNDGGWPTFCRGWGHLPFDRSGADLTAHALRAFFAYRNYSPVHKQRGPAALIMLAQGLQYLKQTQRPDGSWLPLWFGNQHAPDDENPTYGTARVLAAYRDLQMLSTGPAQRGIAWLLAAQNADGSWGGAAHVPSSVEETALAVEALIDVAQDSNPVTTRTGLESCATVSAAVDRGLEWLITAVQAGRLKVPEPIGFYFAKLWYFERLYPILFTVAALGRARLRRSGREPTEQPPIPSSEGLHRDEPRC